MFDQGGGKSEDDDVVVVFVVVARRAPPPSCRRRHVTIIHTLVLYFYVGEIVPIFALARHHIMFLSPCHCPLSWLTCSHSWVQSCYCSKFCLVFSHPWLISCNASSHGVGQFLMFLHSLVCACTASLQSVGWLLQPPRYRIGTPLCLPKSLGLFLCWCSTIGLRIHLNIVMRHNYLWS